MNRRRTEPHVVPGAPPAAGIAGAKQLGQRGSTLVEILIALGIMGVVLTVFVSVLQLGVFSVGDVQERTTAITLVRSQMETIKSAPWPGPYASIAAPDNYTINISVATGPMPAIQVITVTVRHNGRDILTTQGYKGQRS